ncbi:hypothetical protein V6N13_072410 [Hibiscus sabdariffa]
MKVHEHRREWIRASNASNNPAAKPRLKLQNQATMADTSDPRGRRITNSYKKALPIFDDGREMQDHS